MIDKSINNINCVTFREKQRQPTHEAIHLYSDKSQVLDDFTFKNGSLILPANSTAKVMFDITELEELVCKAEIDSQKLDTALNFWTAPFGKMNENLMISFKFRQMHVLHLFKFKHRFGVWNSYDSLRWWMV